VLLAMYRLSCQDERYAKKKDDIQCDCPTQVQFDMPNHALDVGSVAGIAERATALSAVAHGGDRLPPLFFMV
jgi:hypothetical protein